MTEMSWWKSAVIYQIYPRSFQDTDGDGVGDLRGIVRRIPYLIELGVDAIWISPIFRSPMADFGYDVSDYIDIDPLFGTMQRTRSAIAGTGSAGARLPAQAQRYRRGERTDQARLRGARHAPLNS
jgi:alpha-glucosidase